MQLSSSLASLTLLLALCGQSFATSYSQLDLVSDLCGNGPCQPSLSPLPGTVIEPEGNLFLDSPSLGNLWTNASPSALAAEALVALPLQPDHDDLFTALVALPEPVIWLCLGLCLIGLVLIAFGVLQKHPQRLPRRSLAPVQAS